MKNIDIDNWHRKEHFHFFRRLDYPHFNICADVSIAPTFHYAKQYRLSLFQVILFGIMHTVNRIEAFALRIRENQVVKHDIIHPSFTVLNDDQTFSFATMAYTPDVTTFFSWTKQAISMAKDEPSLTGEPYRDDLIYLSCLPWVKFTSVSHPIHMHPADSIPRISWGKITRDNGQTVVPVSVQLHHALADGFHAGLFFDGLHQLFQKPENALGGSDENRHQTFAE